MASRTLNVFVLESRESSPADLIGVCSECLGQLSGSDLVVMQREFQKHTCLKSIRSLPLTLVFGGSALKPC